MNLLRQTVLGALLGLLFHHPGLAEDFTGAGSTFVAPVLAKWSEVYSAQGGGRLAYQSIGSGGGITEIRAAAVDFGVSDAPLKPPELQKFGLIQFPLVVGGVVPVMNIDGVSSGVVKFSGAVLADIFLGKIRKWNDPEIATLNPDVKLPAAAITVVHRSDGSGTTFNWVDYLSKVSPAWRSRVGEGTSVAWPVGVGGKGNEGVAALIQQTKNSIGYVEYAYVLQNTLTYGLVQNRAGKFVTPNAASFEAAAMTADWVGSQDFYALMTDAPGDDAYPIAATSFVLMHKSPENPSRTRAALEFFRWALEKGHGLANDLNYVALPARVVTQIESYWKSQFGGME